MGGDPNLYEYVRGDPVNLLDRTGREPEEATALEKSTTFGAALTIGTGVVCGLAAAAVCGSGVGTPLCGTAGVLAFGATSAVAILTSDGTIQNFVDSIGGNTTDRLESIEEIGTDSFQMPERPQNSP